MPIANQTVQGVASSLPSLALPIPLVPLSAAQPLPIPNVQQQQHHQQQIASPPQYHYQHQSYTPPFNSVNHSTQAQCSAVAPTINFNFHIQMPLQPLAQQMQSQAVSTTNNSLSPISLLSSFFMNNNQQPISATASATNSSAICAPNSAFVSTSSQHTHAATESRSIRNGAIVASNTLPSKTDRLSSSLPLTTSTGVLRDVPAPQSPKLRPRTSVNEPPHLTLPASPLLSRSRLRRHLFRKDEVDVEAEDGMMNTPPPQRASASEMMLSSSAPHQSFMATQLSSKATASSTIPAPPPAHPQYASPRGSALVVGVAPTSKLLSPLTVSTSLSPPLQVSSQSPRLLSSLLLRQIPPPDLSSSTASALASAPGTSSASSPVQNSPSLMISRLSDGKNKALLDQVHRTLASLTIHATKAATASQANPNAHGHTPTGGVSVGGSLLHSQELERSNLTMDSDSWSDSDDSDEEEHEPFCECCLGIDNGGRHRQETESTVLPQSSPSEERLSSHVSSSFFLSTSPSSNEEFSQSKSRTDDQQAFDSDEATAKPRKFQPQQSPVIQRKIAAKMDEQSFYNSTAFSSDDENDNENETDLDRPQEPPTPNANTRPLSSATANKNRFQPSRHSHLCRSARRRRNRKLRLKALKALALQSITGNKSDDLERMDAASDVAEKQKAHAENDALQFNLTLTEEEEDRMT